VYAFIVGFAEKTGIVNHIATTATKSNELIMGPSFWDAPPRIARAPLSVRLSCAYTQLKKKVNYIGMSTIQYSARRAR